MTLVELVVVVTIIGFLMTITISATLSFIRPSTDDIVEKFRSAMYFAYQTAVINSHTVIVDIDLDKKTYSISRVTRSDDGLSEKKIMDVSLPLYNHIKKIVDLRGMTYEKGIVKIPFTQAGIAEDYSVQFGDEYRVNWTVFIHRYNGKIYTKQGEHARTSGGIDQENIGYDQRISNE